MDVDIQRVELGRLHPDLGADRPHIAAGRVDGFLHHIAKLTGGFHPTFTRQAQGFDLQQFAPNRGIGQSGHDTDLILKLCQAVAVLFHAEEILDVVARYGDLVGFLLDDLGQRFPRNLGDLALKVPHAGLAGVVADHAGQRTVFNGKFLCLQTVVLDLLGHKVLFRDLALLILGIARQGDNLHPVKQRPGHVVAVRRGQEHDVRQIVFHFQVVVDECAVLFRIKHLEHGRRRIATEILTHLVDFVEQDKRVRGFRLFQRLNDLAGHGADVGPAVTADLGFVTHAPQRDANKFAPRRLGNRLPKRGFTHTGRADKAHDRAFQLAGPLLHGKIFDDAFFNLFKAIVIIIQHLLCLGEVFFGARLHAPRDRQDPVEVVAHNSSFGRHRRHVLELLQLGVDLFLGLFAQLGVRDAGFQFGDFILAVLTIAKLVLNGLHLLVQIVLALRLLHLGFDAGLDLFLDLQDGHFALHQPVYFLEPLGDGQGFKQVLFLLDLDAEMPRDQIGQTCRLGRFGHRRQRFFGNVLLDLGITLKFFGDGLQQRLSGGLVTGLFRQIFGRGFKEAIIFKVFRDAHPRLPLDQHLHGAIGQLQQLQDIRQDAGVENTIGIGVIHAGVNLARQQDLLVIGHDFFEGAHRFIAAHEKRYNHVGEHHNIAQRQYRVGRVQRL